MDTWFGQVEVLPLVALVVAFAFEAINGFHDTANAVATVIYTHTLRPLVAVVLSGICNALGVLAGGTAVAYSIVHLLPVDLLVESGPESAIAMVLALLLAAMSWNLGTWYLGLPSSSSHALIGAILGVGLVHSGLHGVNFEKAYEVLLSLLVSPFIGFVLAALLLFLARRLIRDPRLFQPPEGEKPPPWWIRAILVTTCSGVSFAHGSNDGQKGMGLIMLVLIGLSPARYAIDPYLGPDAVEQARQAIDALAQRVDGMEGEAAQQAHSLLGQLRERLQGKESLAELSASGRWQYRKHVLELERALKDTLGDESAGAGWRETMRPLTRTVEYVPFWVVIGVSLSLGMGTMVGWKRIVITVGEKIGKTHLSYGQGACAELVAMATIGGADRLGLPVSTTHVLSSGVAGTMWANRSGLQLVTLRNIALAWVFTLPTTVLLAGGLYELFRLLAVHAS